MAVIIKKKGLLEAGIGTGTGTGKWEGDETGTEKVKEAEIRTETGIGTGRKIRNVIGIRIVTIGIGIVTGTVVREERGRGPETKMMMIITGVGNMTGEKR